MSVYIFTSIWLWWCNTPSHDQSEHSSLFSASNRLTSLGSCQLKNLSHQLSLPRLPSWINTMRLELHWITLKETQTSFNLYLLMVFALVEFCTSLPFCQEAETTWQVGGWPRAVNILASTTRSKHPRPAEADRGWEPYYFWQISNDDE